MLVFSRRYHDQVIIIPPGQPPITITVLPARHGHGIRLGFEADPAVAIHRGETVARMAEELAVAEDRAFNHIDIRRHAEQGGLCGPVAKRKGEQ